MEKISKEEAFALQQEIRKLTHEQQLHLLLEEAEFFKNNTNIKDKTKMLGYALHLIIADHKVTKEESYRFKMLGEYWNIDTGRYIKRTLKESAKQKAFFDNL